MTNRTVLYGIGVSAGTASGPLAVVRPAVGVDDSEPAAVEGDSERVKAALQEVAESLKQRAEHANSATSKQVLEATATLATDRGLIRGIEKELKKGTGVTHAIHDAVVVERRGPHRGVDDVGRPVQPLGRAEHLAAQAVGHHHVVADGHAEHGGSSS